MCAPGRINHINNMVSELHSFVALPVTSVPPRSRSFMPTGRCNCIRSPARQKAQSGEVGEKKKGGDDNVRNEECFAADAKPYLTNNNIQATS